jgi:predicted nucleic acid-binding protein
VIYALDTNIISYVLRGDEEIKQRWKKEAESGNRLVIPLIVYYEVMRGLVSANALKKASSFECFCKEVRIADLTVEDIKTAAGVYSECKRTGRPLEDADLLIAAQCISNGYVLVTNNAKHFERIDGLFVDNWKG